MPAQPRIAFSSFASANDLQFAVWERVNSRILGGSPTNRVASKSSKSSKSMGSMRSTGAGLASTTLDHTTLTISVTTRRTLAGVLPSTAPRGVWQLLAANNRELGRSARAYPSFREALDHVAEVREMAAELALRVDRHQYLGTWFWIVDYRDEPVVTSARFFGSAAEAAKTATGAVLAIAQATVDDQARSRPARRGQGDPGRETSDSALW